MTRLPTSLGYGAITGVLFSAPLLGLMYLADKLLDLPFVPFALFDWIATVTPGPLITFGIDLMIEALLLFNLSVADAAKTSEQVAAVILVFAIGVAASAIFFAALRSRPVSSSGFQGSWLAGLLSQPLPGLILGVIVGLPLIVVSLPMGQSTMNPVVTFFILAVLFLVWGVAVGYLRRRLALTRPGGEIEEIVVDGEVRSVSVINRRQFLVRLGATTATLTVASAGLGAVLSQSEQTRINETVASSMPPAEMPPKRPLPNDGDPVTPAPGTRPEFTPVEDHYQVFLRTEPTFIDISNWILPIHGLVANPKELTIDQIRKDYPSRDQYVTLSCISGRIGTHLDQHPVVDRRRAAESLGRRSAPARGQVPRHQVSRRLLRNGSPGPGRLRRADNALLRLGRGTAALRPRLPPAHLAPRPLRNETAQVDCRHRSHRRISRGLLGRARLERGRPGQDHLGNRPRWPSGT